VTQDDVTTTFSTPISRAAWRTWRVPLTFTGLKIRDLEPNFWRSQRDEKHNHTRENPGEGNHNQGYRLDKFQALGGEKKEEKY